MDGSGNPTVSVGMSVGAKNCNGQPGFFLGGKPFQPFKAERVERWRKKIAQMYFKTVSKIQTLTK